MSDLIATSAQALSQDAIVSLYELDLTSFGDGILRFCNGVIHGGPVMFNGYTYYPFPIEVTGFEHNGKGSLPRPTMKVSAIDPTFRALIMSANDLVGAPVKRIRTYRKHLDDGIDPDPLRTWLPDHYVIERKQSQSSAAIQFELSVKMEQIGKKIPARQVIRDTCTHIYRYWDGAQFKYDGVTCPYSGSAMFTQASEVTSNPSKDICGKRISDCKLRFGENSPLPTRAMPGVGRY